MAIRTEQREVFRAVILEIAIDVFHFDGNASGFRMALIPPASRAVLAEILDQERSDETYEVCRSVGTLLKFLHFLTVLVVVAALPRAVSLSSTRRRFPARAAGWARLPEAVMRAPQRTVLSVIKTREYRISTPGGAVAAKWFLSHKTMLQLRYAIRVA